MLWDEKDHPRNKNGRFAKKNNLKSQSKEIFNTKLFNIRDKEYLNKFSIDKLKETIVSEFNVERDNFANQIDKVIKGEYKEYLDLYVCRTPQVLLNIGLPNKPILMRNSKIKEILKNHQEMTVELLKQIPFVISNPEYILKSKTNPNKSVVLISNINTSKGIMVVPIWIEQEGTYIELGIKEIKGKSNFVASAYGRNVQTLINYAKETGGILYKK